MAGFSTAKSLRSNGFAGRVTLIGAESYLPYDRPPLSKQFLVGEADEESLQLASQRAIEELDIEFIAGEAATGVDLQANQVTTASKTFVFDTLVMATGVRARTLPDTAHLLNVRSLRTMADARALRRAYQPGSDLVIIGAGFIGLEVAASARKLGINVSVVETEPIPLGKRLHAPIGEWVRRLHESHGVHFYTGIGVAAIDSMGERATQVGLTDGHLLHADNILVGIGTVPNTDLLAHTMLDLANGIGTDEVGQAAPGLYAVGDVANFHHRGYERRVRLEHRTNANEMAEIVARAINGDRVPYVPVPSFWTDQYESRLQMYGTIEPDSTLEVTSGSLYSDRWAGVYRTGDHLDAALGVNVAKELIPYRRELASRFDAARISAA